MIRNPDANPIGMEFLRRFDVVGDLAAVDCPRSSALAKSIQSHPLPPPARSWTGCPRAGAARGDRGRRPLFWKVAADRSWPVIKEFVGSSSMAPS